MILRSSKLELCIFKIDSIKLSPIKQYWIKLYKNKLKANEKFLTGCGIFYRIKW